MYVVLCRKQMNAGEASEFKRRISQPFSSYDTVYTPSYPPVTGNERIWCGLYSTKLWFSYLYLY